MSPSLWITPILKLKTKLGSGLNSKNKNVFLTRATAQFAHNHKKIKTNKKKPECFGFNVGNLHLSYPSMNTLIPFQKIFISLMFFHTTKLFQVKFSKMLLKNG